jgi:hypothetical protein
MKDRKETQVLSLTIEDDREISTFIIMIIRFDRAGYVKEELGIRIRSWQKKLGYSIMITAVIMLEAFRGD